MLTARSAHGIHCTLSKCLLHDSYTPNITYEIFHQLHTKNLILSKLTNWRQEEKGTAEDEMIGWHHLLNGHMFEPGPCFCDGQRSLACCNSWGRKESNMTERLNWTGLNILNMGFPGGSVVKNLPAKAGDAVDMGSIPGSGRAPEEGHGNPLQYSWVENPMDRGAWQATVNGFAKE